MKNIKPIFDPTTHYRIEVQAPLDMDWLQNFEDPVEIIIDQTTEKQGITVLNVHTDQSGIVGLVRKLHGLGITILQLQIVSCGGEYIEPTDIE